MGAILRFNFFVLLCDIRSSIKDFFRAKNIQNVIGLSSFLQKKCTISRLHFLECVARCQHDDLGQVAQQVAKDGRVAVNQAAPDQTHVLERLQHLSLVFLCVNHYAYCNSKNNIGGEVRRGLRWRLGLCLF